MGVLTATDLTPEFGSRIEGLDLSAPIDPRVVNELKGLLARRKLLLFRQGELEVEQQLALMSALGPVSVEDPGGKPWSLVSNLEVSFVGSSEKLVFHCDFQFTPYGPAEIISLYAETMERAEPTVYVDMVRGFESLPPDLRRRIQDLSVVQLLDYSKNFSESRRSRLSNRPAGAPDAYYPHCTQPMVQVHPKTGKDFLNVSQMQTSHVDGWNDAQSDALFDELERHVYIDQNKYRHNWAVGDLLVWDNISLQHGREALVQAARRSLRRVVVNHVDFATMMHGYSADPERFPGLHKQQDEMAA